MKKIEELRKKFKNPEIFDLAMTHKSWVNENPAKRGSNERLEFLGDAVLELVVTHHLYTKFPDKEEGYLTNLRANIVNTTNLANLAKNIDLGASIFLSKGEQTAGAKNKSLLADTVEAIIGAIYIDSGMKEAQKFIEENLLSDLEIKLKEPLKDAKSRFQESIQAKGLGAPKYKVVKISGPDHARLFSVHVLVKGEVAGEGTGKSKSEAQQKAASQALAKFEIDKV